MYKIFVNDKPLTFGKKEIKKTLNLPYTSKKTFDAAFDILFNTKIEAVNIFHSNPKQIWKKFQKFTTPVHAAGGIVKNSDGKYLFIKRYGMWDLPKGKVEDKENYKEAAIREVEEECSIQDVKLGKYITTTYHVYFDSEYLLKVVHWYKMKYEGTDIPQPQTEENIEFTDWFSKKEIPGLLENTYENIRTLVSNYIL